MPSSEWMGKASGWIVVVLGVLCMVGFTSFAAGVAGGRLEERAKVYNEAAERGLGRWVTNTEFQWKEAE